MRTVIGTILLAGLSLTLAGCGGSSSAAVDEATYTPRMRQTEVEVVAARRQKLGANVEFTGNLLPRRVTRIISEVDGVVREVPQVGAKIDVVVDGKAYSERLGISYGQVVTKDDVLVQLETSDEEVALKIAQAKLRKAQADLAQLRTWERPEQITRLTALRDEAKARHDQAVQHSRRVETLHQRNATTLSDLEQSVTDVSTTKATLRAAEAVLAQAKAGPTADEIAVQEALVAQAEAEVEQHQREIEKATIRAPYDGVITAFNVEVGDRVSPGGNPVAEIMDLRYLVAEIAVPEKFVGQVQLNDGATLQAAGAENELPGLVIAVNDMVDPQTRTFNVRVAIDNEQRRFKAGQFSTVRLNFGADDSERLAVPNSALVYVEGEPHVFTVKSERVHATPVQVGLSNDTLTEIASGISEGDVVVVDDPTLLTSDMDVTVKNTHVAQQIVSSTTH
ncbi:efflux RND transporter periplasmic adaptor subunit [Rubinisphaera brasiliensis]|uniref:Efflux transporter, RND family, MFP subunit n=1 Tax=Rubinisphaera brasiliensis (strain ATCC 49424 / DSM 5305 / JCM 21570 / IAM 15109 / NBRC 103401 / IFAM 1448) TaxID=756272 RepID=F0SJ23_RUBBR|nr:efflux RND transporter periplasmic adaptor subunit [Rubinisphaera brasiliensis]ADY58565.1 efflux transporter, RND family, MFP subunit [Rubinisphaera brasiliensis DSM 5305]